MRVRFRYAGTGSDTDRGRGASGTGTSLEGATVAVVTIDTTERGVIVIEAVRGMSFEIFNTRTTSVRADMGMVLIGVM